MVNKIELKAEEIKGLQIGHIEDETKCTGITVLYFPGGAAVGCDISGGGPASRETPLTMPMTADNPINAIVLSGGSAYGLAAADGVMKCLEDHKIGYDTGVALVPLVCQSCIFDLGYGSPSIRPDADLGYKACEKALKGTDGRMGNIGGGAGATVGKICGMAQASKSGFGMHSVQIDDLEVTAVVIVNALGDVYNPMTNEKIAGLMNAERTELMDSGEMLMNFLKPRDMFTGNTTIGAVITNGKFNKAQMNKIASMARTAYARCLSPVGTMADGDTIYAASVGSVSADINAVGFLAGEVMEKAIIKAVENSKMDDSDYLATIR